MNKGYVYLIRIFRTSSISAWRLHGLTHSEPTQADCLVRLLQPETEYILTIGPFTHYPSTPDYFGTTAPLVSGNLVLMREPTLTARASDTSRVPTDTTSK